MMASASEEKVVAILKVIISSHLDIQPNDISLEADLIRDLGADSLEIIRIQQQVEDVFKTPCFSNAEENAIHCVQDLAAVVLVHIMKNTGKIPEFYEHHN